MFTEGQEILEKRYKVIKRLGGGAFGEIYRGNYNTTLEESQLTNNNHVFSREKEDWRTFGC